MSKKRKNIILSAGVLSLLLIANIVFALFFGNPFSKASRNKRSFQKAVLSLSDDVKEVPLNNLTSFDWDYVYIFSPYTSDEEIHEIIGFESDMSLMIQTDSEQNLLFVKGNEVVCRVIR